MDGLYDDVPVTFVPPGPVRVNTSELLVIARAKVAVGRTFAATFGGIVSPA